MINSISSAKAFPFIRLIFAINKINFLKATIGVWDNSENQVFGDLTEKLQCRLYSVHIYTIHFSLLLSWMFDYV